MLVPVAVTHSATGLLHQLDLMIEMRAHELFFQPRQEKCKLGRLAADRLKPPIRYRLMVRIDYTMTKQMLSSD